MIFIEICLFIFAFYRGRGKEAVISLIIFVIVVISSVELANESSRFVNLADLFLILALGTMSFFPKKDTRPRCPQCNELIDEEKLSCEACGHVLGDTNFLEQITDNRYIKTVVIETDKDFENIKQSIIDKYEIKGYTLKAIDKVDSLMLKHPEINNSYILV